MSSPLELDFSMTGAGWAGLTVRKGGRSHEIESFSYLSDALDDLVRLGIDIATDRSFGWARFLHEPGSTILFAESGWWAGATDWVAGYRLSTISSRDYGESEPEWNRLHRTEREFMVELETRDELPNAILEAARRIESDLGTEGYAKRWTGRLGFPSRAVAALRAALATPSLPAEPWRS